MIAPGDKLEISVYVGQEASIQDNVQLLFLDDSYNVIKTSSVGGLHNRTMKKVALTIHDTDLVVPWNPSNTYYIMLGHNIDTNEQVSPEIIIQDHYIIVHKRHENTEAVTDTNHFKVRPNYAFGWNTQEKVDEIAGPGNHYTAKYWDYDSRAVFRWNTDPRPNPSMSVYSINQGNPIWFNDPFGDTVRYGGFRERLDVGISRLMSKEFREEFNQLKEDTDVFTYNNTGEETGVTGNVTLKTPHLNYNEFTINYSTKDSDRKAPNGKGALHGIFEETFHATDYLKTRDGVPGGSGIDLITDASRTSGLGWNNPAQRKTGEAMAWKFAANNNITAKSSGYFPRTAAGVDRRAFAVRTKIGLIQDATTMQQIEDILFNGWTLEYFIPHYQVGDKPATKPMPPTYR